MFITDNKYTNAYVSQSISGGKQGVAKGCFPTSYPKATTTTSNDTFVKSGDNKNTSTTIDAAALDKMLYELTTGESGAINATAKWSEILGSFAKTLGGKVAYYAGNKALDDAVKKDVLNNKEICNTTANMSQNVYQNTSSTIDGWEPYVEQENEKTGFKATAYKKDNDIIIAYRGTNDSKDLTSDAQMAAGKLPEQYEDAEKFFKEISKNNPDCSVVVTGHSLGGSLAELVASKYDDTAAITYNAFGVDNIINSEQGKQLKMQDNNNSFNYIVNGDPVSNCSKHVGTTTVVEKTKSNNHAIANYVNMWA